MLKNLCFHEIELLKVFCSSFTLILQNIMHFMLFWIKFLSCQQHHWTELYICKVEEPFSEATLFDLMKLLHFDKYEVCDFCGFSTYCS